MKLIAKLLLWGSLLGPVNLLAQLGGGSIVGVVLDPSGSVIVAAKIEATNIGTNEKKKTVTNEQGYYEFPLLPAGTYVLSAEQPGFKKATSAKILLHGGTKPRIDITMPIGEVTETVEVVATAPLINATTTDLGTVLDSRKMADLPLNGRNFLKLIVLQPGVQTRMFDPVSGGSQASNRGGVEFNGSPALGNNYLMDGLDMSFGEVNGLGDSGAGTGGQGTVINVVSVEAIQEFKATSSASSAEYGRSTGGVINVTTKSGTNKFHGTVFESLQNDVLNASSFFANRSGLKKPSLRQNQYGANLGGPIKRDKVFFFFTF